MNQVKNITGYPKTVIPPPPLLLAESIAAILYPAERAIDTMDFFCLYYIHALLFG